MKDIQANVTLIIVVLFWIFFIGSCVMGISENNQSHRDCVAKYGSIECERKELLNNGESESSIKSDNYLPPR